MLYQDLLPFDSLDKCSLCNLALCCVMTHVIDPSRRMRRWTIPACFATCRKCGVEAGLCYLFLREVSGRFFSFRQESSRSRKARRSGTIKGCRSLTFTWAREQHKHGRYSAGSGLVWSMTSWTKPGSPRQECKSKTLITHGVCSSLRWSHMPALRG